MRCPVCGTDNQPEARFCFSCGTRLEASPARETRKTVTIVFCDMARSTELGERLDPEALRRVMTRYFDTLRTVLERHGGTVEKFIGDAVMAVFGVPQLHEDDALRAVRAADEMRHALDRLNAELEREMGITIAARIGVNTGPVLTVQSGQGLVTGDAVNAAARLEQAAQPGTILLGQSTYRLVRDAVTVEPVDDLRVKGKSEALAAVRLLSVIPLAEAHARHLDSPMVGRESELELLRQSYQRAVAQRACQLFTLLGSAGVGKSRLVAEFLAGVSDEASVMRVRCLAYGEGITYWPIAEAIRQAARVAEEDTRTEAQVKLGKLVTGREADRVAPLIAELMGLTEGGSAQDDLFWAVRTLLESLATERPLVAVIDDIHWAEPTLLDLIEYVADWSRDSAILLLCPARPELLDTRPGWGGGKLNAASLLLEPLGSDASHELITNLLGAQLPATIGERISRAAEGNPLFVEEMISMLVDDGRLRSEGSSYELVGEVEDLDVPPTIEALLSSRLERLSPGERSVAEHAAVVGRVFELTAVVELAAGSVDGEGNGNGTATRVRGDLMGLLRKELIRPDRSGVSRDESFRFRHQLIRDAAYGGLPKEERAALHERFAGWLERRAGERIPEYEEIVGYHLEQAVRYRREVGLQRPDDADLATRAGRHLASAGRKAVALTDLKGSVNLLTRARDLLPPDDPDRPLLGAELALALTEVGTDDEVEQVLQDSTAGAGRLGDERLLAHVQIMGGILGGRISASGRWRMGAADLEWANQVEPLARRAIEIFTAAGDHLGLARSWEVVGGVGWSRGRIADEELAVDEALRHARAAGSTREEAELMFVLTRDLVQGPTPVKDGIARCQQILRETKGDRTIESYMFHALAHLQARLGEFEAARDFASRYRAKLWESGQVASYWIGSEVTSEVEEMAGKWEAAVDMLQEGIANLRGMASTHLLLARLARDLAAVGRDEDAEQAALETMSGGWTRGTAVSAATMAGIRARQGQFDEALGLIDQAAANFAGTDFMGWHAEVLDDRAEVMRLAGRQDDAAAAARQAIALCEQKGDVVSAARLRARHAVLLA
jgi:class 3 adenylate cyclase/tetratricopeptide (TPR) repeat protein